MAIDNILQQILSAVYGKDVRQAIHDGIEECYNAMSSASDVTNVASNFSTSTAYSIGQFVTYDSHLYRFVANHPAGAWNESHVTRAAATTYVFRNSQSIADTFDPSNTYAVGDYAIYTYLLYRFTTAHTGEFNASHCTRVTTASELKLILTDIANVFSPSRDYTVGQFVTYGGSLYKFIANHSAGAWNSSHVESATVGTNVYKNSTNFANLFDASTSYSVGDYVIYDYYLWRFTSSHTGAWNANHVTRVRIASELGRYDGKASQALTNIANDFSTTRDYSNGQFVTYGGDLYRFNTDHSAGAWNSSQVDSATLGTNVYKNATNFGLMFDSSHSYAIGDYAIYDYYLWRFTSAHSGAWNSSHVTRVHVVDEIRNAINKFVNEFSSTRDYTIGQFVIHDGNLYKFIVDHSAGSWNSSHVEIATLGTNVFKNNRNIATAFDSAHTYSIGDYAIYDYNLYRFTSVHTGAWNTSHVTLVKVMDEVSQALSNIANSFTTSRDYEAGQFVTYGGVLYKFDVDHSAGAWNSNHVSVATAGTNIFKNSQSIGYMFSPSASYSIGDYVIHDYYLWRFTSNHSAGAWNSNQVTRVRLADEVSRSNEKLQQVMNNTANTFSSSTSYLTGQFVTYGGVLYKFDADHPAGAWTGDDVSVATAGTNIYKNSQSIAYMFDPSSDYVIGDYVIHDYYLWRFVADHSAGEWNGYDAARVRLADEVERIIRRVDEHRDSPLWHKKINFLGDSYIANNGQAFSDTWAYKLGSKYGMTVRNYGVNGNGIVSGSNPMSTRYKDMDLDADYVIVVGGTNDFNAQTDLTTFRNQLAVFIAGDGTSSNPGLTGRYPRAKIAFFTMWNSLTMAVPSVGTKTWEKGEYNDVIIEECEHYGIPVFDSWRRSGIHPYKSATRTAFFQADNDWSHLNSTGHDFFLSTAEAFLNSL